MALLVAVCGVGILIYGYDERKLLAKFAGGAALAIAAIIFGLGLTTASGQLKVKKLFASTTSSQWLIVDASGGKIMRHWILENGFVESVTDSDGWQFYDGEGNLCYVGGDSFIMKINIPLDSFRKDYKKLYNIPEDQAALK